MLNETGISSSVDENDIKSYLQEILEEVKVEKRRKKEQVIPSVLSISINAYHRKISTNIAEARQIDNTCSITHPIKRSESVLEWRVQYDLYYPVDLESY